MKKESMYHELAKYYNFIYSWKDYKKDAIRLNKLISKYKKSGGSDMLDAACGTGNHLKFFKNKYRCTGIDISNEMLKIARRNVKGVQFKRGNMLNFDLHKKFDVILCLFSSIGYVKAYSNLRKTIKNFSRHLKQGGVLIIEAWISKSDFKRGLILINTYESERTKITRMATSRIKNGISILELRYLIGENGKIKYFKELQELGFFDVNKTIKIMNDENISAKFFKKGLMKERGIYIGVKK